MLAYIHIPYCDSKCHYCAFNSYTGKLDTRQSYISALFAQTGYELKRFSAVPGSIETLYIGGGTPSTIEPALFEPVFEVLRPYLASDAEITVEANPNSASIEWLEGMKNLGANRISFGVQSFDEKKLKFLGRAHSPTQAISAIKNAADIGFEHINLDLIYNVRGDGQELLESDIKKAFALPIDHISAYELTIESDTPFASAPNVSISDEKLAFFIAKEIKNRGFEHYEISNFGSYQSKHNKGYWMQKDYMGIGAGAVGFLGDKRFYPQTNIDSYIENPLNISEETLETSDLLTEMIFLGLRSNVGVEIAQIPAALQKKADLLLREGKLVKKRNRLFNPDFFIADEIALFLLGD